MYAPIAAIEAALRQNTSALPTALQAHEAPIVDPGTPTRCWCCADRSTSRTVSQTRVGGGRMHLRCAQPRRLGKMKP